MEEPTRVLPQGQQPTDLKHPNPGQNSAVFVQDSKKRKPDLDGFRSSKYFKICTIVKDLRPFFIDILQTPNFGDNKASHEIQIRLKSLVELIKQLRNEAPAKEPLSNKVKEESMVKPQERERTTLHPQSGEHPPASLNTTENDNKEESKELLSLDKEEFQGPFLVGGSPIGWNFLVYPGHKPIFYGTSKETALARRASE